MNFKDMSTNELQDELIRFVAQTNGVFSYRQKNRLKALQYELRKRNMEYK